jgi:hypothetical protein
MTNVLWMLALMAQDAELGLDVKTRRTGTEYELSIAGRIAGAADGTTVGLRFHRLTRRARWEDRAIESAVEEDGPGRAAALEQGRFTHVERFDAPGEVEVRFIVDGADAPVRRQLRVGTPGDVVGAAQAAAKRIDDALRALAVLAEEAGRCPEEGAVGAKRKQELRRLLAKAREVAGRAVDGVALPAAAGALKCLAADIDAAVSAHLEDRPLCRWISNLSGASFCLEDAAGYLEGVEDLALRERSVVLLGELESARTAAAEAAMGSDRKRWNRSLHAAKQAVEAARRAADPRLGNLPDEVETFLGVAEAAMTCENAAEAGFRELHQELSEKVSILDRALRGLK